MPIRVSGAVEVRVVEEESYAMNFSGEPLYRFVGVGDATGQA